MKPTFLLPARAGLLSFSIQRATAKCYTNGDSWPNREEARSFVHDACYKDDGMSKGYYAPRQMKSMCPQSGGIGLVFNVQNQNTEVGSDIGDDDCYYRLSNEIFGCEHGGASVVAGWYFRDRSGAC